MNDPEAARVGDRAPGVRGAHPGPPAPAPCAAARRGCRRARRGGGRRRPLASGSRRARSRPRSGRCRHAEPALFSLPAPDACSSSRRKAAASGSADANGYKRKLGAYTDAEWSPHGLYVIATTPNHLIAFDVEHGIRWTLARRDPVWPRWEGTTTDTRIAYLAASGLRVVAGDGTGDHLLDRYAAAVPPAWDPAPDRTPLRTTRAARSSCGTPTAGVSFGARRSTSRRPR